MGDGFWRGTDETFGGFPGSGFAEGVGVGCSGLKVLVVVYDRGDLWLCVSYLMSFTHRASLIICLN